MLSDKNLKKEVSQYVLHNGYVKGKLNFPLQMLVTWVKETKGIDICTSTASLWLHNLGFSYHQFSKGVYFDHGHEHDDVIESRKVYQETIELFQPRVCVLHSPCPNPLCHPVIYDESTFFTNAAQRFHWTDGSKQRRPCPSQIASFE